MKIEEVNTRGGKRENAGRPRQFGNPTTNNFKCELETKLKAKKKYGRDLNRMFNEWLNELINEKKP